MLFELIAERYERRSLVITCNQPFGEWGQIFPDPAVTRGDRPPRPPRHTPPADLLSAWLIKTFGSVAMPGYSHLLVSRTG